MRVVDVAVLAAWLAVGFVCGFFTAIELHRLDPPCLLNDPPCVIGR